MRKAPNPTGKGGYKKGVSGNPSGVSKEKKQEQIKFQELCRGAADEAFQVIITLMRDKRTPKRLRKDCAEFVIERAHGKAVQPTREMGEGESYSEFLKGLTT